MIQNKENRKTAKQIFDEARGILDTIGRAANVEPLPASSPVFIVAWEHWESAFLIASVRADDMQVAGWVFNQMCLNECRRIIGHCLNAYTRNAG